MINFKEFIELFESKNTHLEHIEDELINLGKDGVERSFELFTNLLATLKGHTDTPINITTKWDGAPAVFVGTDPADGKFFVGTKGVFAKISKMNKRISDINKNHANVKKGDTIQNKSSLRKKLKTSFKLFKHLGIDGYVLQGDLLYTKDSIRKAVIDDEPHIIFRPNTITYTVPTKSKLAKEMLASEIGIVFHTLYTGGPTIHDMTASFGFDANKLKRHSGIWFDDANFKDVSGQVNLTLDEAADIQEAIRQARNDFWQLGDVYKFLDDTEHISDLKVELKAHINSFVRKGVFEGDPVQFANTFIERYINKQEKAILNLKSEMGQSRRRHAMEKGVQFLRDNTVDIQMMYDMYLKLIQVKSMFVEKLSNLRALDSFIEQEDGSFQVTKPEGFVAVDHVGGAIKLVDRLEFSAANFNPNKTFGESYSGVICRFL